MFKINTKRTIGIILVTILVILGVVSCSSTAIQGTTSSPGQQQPSSPAQQSGTQPAQKPSSSGQQTSGQQSAGSPGQPPGNANMDSILKRAAEILGISTDKFTTAFQNAMPKRSGSDQQGQPPSGGQLPMPPAGQQGQQGQPPAPSANQSMTQSQIMTEVYAKMATELNISADSIAKAMAQAEKELKSTSK